MEAPNFELYSNVFLLGVSKVVLVLVLQISSNSKSAVTDFPSMSILVTIYNLGVSSLKYLVVNIDHPLLAMPCRPTKEARTDTPSIIR